MPATHKHDPDPLHQSRRCTATTAAGNPCRNWAVPGTNPPRCGSHGGTERRQGAPIGNTNARTHGFYLPSSTHPPYTIDEIIADLSSKQRLLSQHIDQLTDDADLPALVTLFRLHAQTASRLSRLLRDQRALSGLASDGISGAIAQALDELSTELATSL